MAASKVEQLLSGVEKQRAFLDVGCTATIDVGTDLAESAGSYEKQISNLESYTATYAELDREVDTLKAALENIRKVVAKRPTNQDEIPNLPELFQQYYDEAAQKINTTDIRHHPRCAEFRQKVYGRDGPVTQATGVTGNEDDDLIVSQVEKAMICPITQQPFVEPVQNQACKHSYSKQAILEHLKKKHGRVRCPVLGCVQVVTADDLTPDHALQGKLRRLKHALAPRK